MTSSYSNSPLHSKHLTLSDAFLFKSILIPASMHPIHARLGWLHSVVILPEGKALISSQSKQNRHCFLRGFPALLLITLVSGSPYCCAFAILELRLFHFALPILFFIVPNVVLVGRGP